MDFYFLLFTLFFPRLVMLVYIFFYPHLFPVNSVPQWAELALGIFVPRILVLIFIYQNMGYNNIWFVAHFIVMLMTYFGGGRFGNNRRNRRRDR